MQSMQMDFHGLTDAGTFADMTEIPKEWNIVDAEWLHGT